jgi:hypothetical protein
LQRLVVGVLVGGEVHSEHGGAHIVLVLDLGAQRVELGLGAGYKDQVEAFGGELERELLSDTI